MNAIRKKYFLKLAVCGTDCPARSFYGEAAITGQLPDSCGTTVQHGLCMVKPQSRDSCRTVAGQVQDDRPARSVYGETAIAGQLPDSCWTVAGRLSSTVFLWRNRNRRTVAGHGGQLLDSCGATVQHGFSMVKPHRWTPHPVWPI